jgi:uncharacterized protein (DUF427 family)
MLPEENVWDYPRPPRLERVGATIVAVFGGLEIVRTTQAWRVLETSHPPTYYIPTSDIAPGILRPAPGRSLCEWKGAARYWSLAAGGRCAAQAGWSYPNPTPAFLPIRDHVALYRFALDTASIGGIEVMAQPGDFYGGWITPNLRGPFKGGPGSSGW